MEDKIILEITRETASMWLLAAAFVVIIMAIVMMGFVIYGAVRPYLDLEDEKRNKKCEG